MSPNRRFNRLPTRILAFAWAGFACVLLGAADPAPIASAAAVGPAHAEPSILLPAKVQQVGKAHAEGLLGQPVTDGHGDEVGHIVDVLIDPSGMPDAAVVEFAGFFGLGNRQIAVDYKALTFTVASDRIAIRLTMDADKLKSMPEYKPEASSVPVATSSTAAVAKPH